jgi:S1-C subfamily serine protease
MENVLMKLSDSLAEAVERAGRSVVTVNSGGRLPSSGVHWKPGMIVTAEHALRRDEEITIGLPDGSTATAEIAGRDPGTDLAILRVDAGSLPVVAGATQPPVRAGDIVLTVGRTKETGVCAAMGIISVTSGAWQTWRGGRLDGFIRLDLALYPGSAGGAVVNTQGEVIGIATSVLSRIAPIAIPRTTVDRVTGELSSRGYIARGYLGVGLQPVRLPEELAKKLNMHTAGGKAGGLIVLSVEKDGPAERANLVIGDILIALDGHPVMDTRDVQALLGAERIGRTVPVSVIRGGNRTELTLTIGERTGRG